MKLNKHAYQPDVYALQQKCSEITGNYDSWWVDRKELIYINKQCEILLNKFFEVK